MLVEHEAATQAQAADLVSADRSASLYRKAVKVTGHYLVGQQILLDNQVWQGRVGYRVWTPLALADGRLVMVDRGWVRLGGDRAHPPRPRVAAAGRRQVRGIWRGWPEPGLRLDADDICAARSWPRVLNYPRYEDVACQYQRPVLDGLLLLDEGAAGGFPRDWGDVGLPPARHIGYAVQWFALAVAVLIIFLVVNVKRKQKP